ncbi:hypothetical protein DBV15_03156 [Temnothorax longispinosus]|uniref:Uncharacterized protein n=1 Tax=Temnothorax longispinosus TaxID=300112 RepID=A0A4S2KP89_9HYME|nr:hypothetical protein DBV15_03156 [Temnothorax longispinosus]
MYIVIVLLCKKQHQKTCRNDMATAKKHVRRGGGPSRLVRRAILARKQRRFPSCRWGKPACAPGYKCMCVADERARNGGKRGENANREEPGPSACPRRGCAITAYGGCKV